MSYDTNKKKLSETSLERMAKTLQEKGVLVNRNNVRKIPKGFKRGNLDMIIGDPVIKNVQMPSTPRSFAYSPMAKPGEKTKIILGGWDNKILKEHLRNKSIDAVKETIEIEKSMG